MAKFIQVHDQADGTRALVNIEEVAKIEERAAGCAVYMRFFGDDYDRTKRQVVMYVNESFDYFSKQIDSTW